MFLSTSYKTLQLSAMGAAIPHLLRLVAALPPILPFAADEFHQTITTGTVSVQDELIPDDEEEDITYQTRDKSSLFIVITIGDGKPDVASGTSRKKQAAPTTRNGGNFRGGKRNSKPSKSSGQLVFQEPEQQ
ncbi:hypothetical protein ONZ45_g5386 [Pleurotus djamor]|nr:hypothetical protein ONZ45_g5386 [Pleurotus djamor]